MTSPTNPTGAGSNRHSSDRVDSGSDHPTVTGTTGGVHADPDAWTPPASTSSAAPKQTTPTPILTNARGEPAAARQVNMFSLVERFTFRRSLIETDLPYPLPLEIQYWAGVVMRNACRKDDTRGGIRQCASGECLQRYLFVFLFSILERHFILLFFASSFVPHRP